MYGSGLILIDMQNDFINPDGGLPVNNALNDVRNVVSFIQEHIGEIDYFALTADAHYTGHVGFHWNWTDDNGNEVKPFTVITYEDYKKRKYICKSLAKIETDILFEILNKHNMNLTLWTGHCLKGTEGACINKDIMDTIFKFSKKFQIPYQILEKGSDNTFEQYSALSPGLGNDIFLQDTFEQCSLIKSLKECKKIYIAGEALDFCVKETILDLCREHPYLIKRMTLLADCSSPVNKDFKIEEDEGYKKFLGLGGSIFDTKDLR